MPSSAVRQWSIREAHGSDVEDIVRLVELARDQPDSRAVDLVELLVDLRNGEPAMVAAVGSDLVGVVVASIAGDTARIDVLVIAPAWRHQGMGSALLRAIEERVLHLGARKLWALLGPGQVGEEALRNRGFTATRGLVLYEKLEPIVPSDVSLLDAWGGELVGVEAWDAVAGFHREKEIIDSRIIAPLAEPQLAREIGVRPPATVILFGPPGTGKTTFARGIAGRLGWPFVEVAPSKLAGGDGLAAELRRAFTELGALEHAVVFLDEFDEIAASRLERREMQGVVNEFLKVIPPFRARPGRLLLCATNFIDQIDPAVIRPGRFDLIVPIGPPDPAARWALWEAVLDGLATEGIDVAEVVARTEGFTPADVALAAQRAAAAAFDRARAGEGPPVVGRADVLAAVARTPPSVTPELQEHFRRDVERFERV